MVNPASQDETPPSAPDGARDEHQIALRSVAGVFVVAATVLASAIGFLDATVVNVAVPAIGKELKADVPSLQWMVTSYLVTVAALLIVAGSLADRFGRKRILMIGLSVTFVASILCAISPNADVLVVFRILQGVGGALLVPSSLALLNATLRPGDRARGIGIWVGLATLGSTVGPSVGGWLVDNASWHWLFLLNVPLVLVGLLLLLKVPESRNPAAQGKIDWIGSALAAIGLGGLVYALTDGASNGWNSPVVLVVGAVAIACLVALIPFERSRANPMLQLRLFRSKQFNAINGTTLLFYGALAGASYLTVLRLQLQLDYSATAAGSVFIPTSIVLLTVSPISGWLVARFGPRWLMAVGILTVAVSFIWLSFLAPGSSYLLGVLPGTLVEGLGAGLAVAPLTATVLGAVRSADLGEASAINDAVSRLGGVIAIALLPALAGATGNLTLADTLEGSFAPGMVVAALLCVAAAIITILFVSNSTARAPEHAKQPIPVE
jgi:EmrB/QacA subfamily drug resistance transporter